MALDSNKPKFKVGDQVILLDYSDGRDDGVYNYFWVKSYDEYIGKIFTVKSCKWDTYRSCKNTWVYALRGLGDINGFNEHWLEAVEFLTDEDICI